mmetsp:Transcript_57389/g.107972  ORF Transcript_57389/g.107972 Transcript_57389/m.107972 type:complete len:406 (+) Transcript_57389:239-1456(+)
MQTLATRQNPEMEGTETTTKTKTRKTGPKIRKRQKKKKKSVRRDGRERLDSEEDSTGTELVRGGTGRSSTVRGKLASVPGSPKKESIDNRGGGDDAALRPDTKTTNEEAVESAADRRVARRSMNIFALCCAGDGDGVDAEGGDADNWQGCGCLSQEQCAWLCFRSQGLGAAGFGLQFLCCAPLNCCAGLARRVWGASLLGVGGLPCGLGELAGGLHRPPPPPNPEVLLRMRSALRKSGSGVKEPEEAKSDPTSGDGSPASCRKGGGNSWGGGGFTSQPDDVCVVKVLGTDQPLEDDVALLHPLVRLHWLDAHTGKYLQRRPFPFDSEINVNEEAATLPGKLRQRQQQQQQQQEGGPCGAVPCHRSTPRAAASAVQGGGESGGGSESSGGGGSGGVGGWQQQWKQW